MTKVKVDEKFLKKISEKIFKKEKKTLELSIALVNPERIRRLNKKYRGKNKTTDILSFLYDGSGEINKFDSSASAAEIIICPRQVRQNAKKLGEVFKRELAAVLIHGILHLLGQDHEASEKKAQKMKRKQEYYINLIFK